MSSHRGALISVSDKRGLKEFASQLVALGYELFSSSGTRQYLVDHGLPCTAIDSYTGQQEILDGRVKTLHPRIHAGILARRDDSAHMRELERERITPLDVVVVNLYPFLEKVQSELRDNPTKMVEFVDVGGPAMIRAAAKNHAGVFPVIDPDDYPKVSEALSSLHAGTSDLASTLSLRRSLAAKVFAHLAADNLEAARYFSSVDSPSGEFPPFAGVVLRRQQPLRYGENPHQGAAWYSAMGLPSASLFRQLNGKELSYNNLLDFEATRRMTVALAHRFPALSCAIIVKHLNPCGAGVDTGLQEALHKAKCGDPRSHFGGVLGFSARVDEATARMIREDFAEIVLAPAYDPQALEILRSSKTLRVIEANLDSAASPRGGEELRSCAGGYLLQQSDSAVSRPQEARGMSSRTLSTSEEQDMELAWTLCAQVKSNAIVIARGGMLVGVGAGQMSRIDAAELAVARAKRHGHSLQGAVAASDAFFPFPDTVELLASEGVVAVMAPSGAKRDDETVRVAEKSGISLLFTSDRHFRH